eukprot:CAMPEP_0114486880 /NCGR_PEP_ID=MMETSP0109-20121206/458_1 /TAXON_ID=29199 /ORGANISM="Chlorarachnion reptans, Strain CCCM449" /LENGTH=86 /DNA_ID=CAMNT_0001663087 /DNA_START=489 /DNA_END=749 /DNA_ORIENTATION=+
MPSLGVIFCRIPEDEHVRGEGRPAVDKERVAIRVLADEPDHHSFRHLFVATALVTPQRDIQSPVAFRRYRLYRSAPQLTASVDPVL